MRIALLAALAIVSLAAGAADDRFRRSSPDSTTGFMPARDPVYVKECGACHFPYSPGMLPARSWALQLERMERHFGETVKLDAQTRAQLSDYLAKNAADVSPFEGSRTLMERVRATDTPYRFSQVPLFREMHTVMWAVLNVKNNVKVRTLTNCNACHQRAAEGSFANEELYIPGLTGR